MTCKSMNLCLALITFSYYNIGVLQQQTLAGRNRKENVRREIFYRSLAFASRMLWWRFFARIRFTVFMRFIMTCCYIKRNRFFLSFFPVRLRISHGCDSMHRWDIITHSISNFRSKHQFVSSKFKKVLEIYINWSEVEYSWVSRKMIRRENTV